MSIRKNPLCFRPSNNMYYWVSIYCFLSRHFSVQFSTICILYSLFGKRTTGWPITDRGISWYGKNLYEGPNWNPPIVNIDPNMTPFIILKKKFVPFRKVEFLFAFVAKQSFIEQNVVRFIPYICQNWHQFVYDPSNLESGFSGPIQAYVWDNKLRSILLYNACVATIRLWSSTFQSETKIKTLVYH